MDNFIEKEGEQAISKDFGGNSGSGQQQSGGSNQQGGSSGETNMIDQGLGDFEKKEGLPDNNTVNNDIAQQVEKQF